MILALDLGTKLGYCRQIGGDLDYGTVHLQPGKTTIGERYSNFSRLLDRFYGTGIQSVVYEQVTAHRGSYDAHAYGAYQGILQMFCHDNKLPCTSFHWATVKKAVTGNGRAKKDQVIRTIRALGYDPQDDNAADAIAVWYTSRRMQNGILRAHGVGV